jgi:hypothetical protein
MVLSLACKEDRKTRSIMAGTLRRQPDIGSRAPQDVDRELGSRRTEMDLATEATVVLGGVAVIEADPVLSL